MTETYGSFIHGAHGPVHSGAGDQYNNHVYYQAAESRLREQASRRPRSIAKDDRLHLAARFVPPPRLQQARDRLAKTHTVLVDGLPGNGRRTAALMLLHELPHAHGSLYELPDTSDDRTASPLDPDDVNSGDRLLLDLSEVEEAQYLAVQRDLPDFRTAVVARDAHLVVVLPHHLGYLLRGELRHLAVEVGRPAAKRVLAVRLRCGDLAPPRDELQGPKLATYLARAPMREVAMLADRILVRRDASPADQGFASWLAESLDDQHNQTVRVAADFTALQGGRERALLLSVAMFHETTPDVVLQATNALLGGLRHPPDDTPRLDRADLHAELSAIGAETHPDGQVRFRSAGYDRAVRDHFWTYLPDIRCQLREWFRASLAELAIGPEMRTEALARFADQCLRTARPEDLAWLAEQWASAGGPARLFPEAAQALAHGLDDDRHGRFFRQRIYDWATSADIPDRLRGVLIPVCSQTMARSHPDQALVRLHHLARRSPGNGGADAAPALMKLARSEDRLYQQMLDRLSRGISRRQGDADPALFVELADPRRRIGYRDTQTALVTCWAGVLRRSVDLWAGAMERWLTAAESIRHRELILRVLVAACAGDPRLSGCLYRVSLGWQRSGLSIERVATVAALLRKINAAQGVGHYARTA
ncbi:ABC transporter substrate-binding protein [Streptomyces sp. NPDC057806]|uniref:ABC transporter substrate-binding protein n=1 Tax=Streptomyces sp. NPDC057806 TaxID=3346255 RepID=UPI0036AD492E